MKNINFIFIIVIFAYCSDKKEYSTMNKCIDEKICDKVKRLDTIPDVTYDKIFNLSFVMDRVVSLEEKNIRTSFYTAKKPENVGDCFIIQMGADEENRMIPVFNFFYYSLSDSLFYLDIKTDSMVYVN